MRRGFHQEGSKALLRQQPERHHHHTDEQVLAVILNQLRQNAFGGFDNGVDAGFIRAALIDVCGKHAFRVRFFQAVRCAIRAGVRVRTHGAADRQYGEQ